MNAPTRIVRTSRRVERDVAMTTRTGEALRADVYRDAEAREGRPCLLMRTPYDKRFVQLGIYPHPFWFVDRGYLVVVQDVRGRFASEGEFEPFRYEAGDGYDAVEWAATLPGCDGRVGMYGASYAGAVQLLAAVEQPPSLRAIAPAVTTGDFYRWFYEGGALQYAFAAYWAAQLGEYAFRRQGAEAEAAATARALGDLGRWYGSDAPARLEPIRKLGFFADWLGHPERDDYWAELSASTRYDDLRAACLHISGFYDIFLPGTLEDFDTLHRLGRTPEQLLVVGPWAHWPWGTDAAGAVTFDEAAVDLALDVQLRFFDRHLRGADVPSDRPVQCFPPFGDRWIAADAWPPDDLGRVELYLDSAGSANRMWGDGRLTAMRPERVFADYFAYHGANPVPSVGGHSCLADFSLQLMGPYERSAVEKWYEVLCYTSAPFEDPVVLLGPGSVIVFVQSSAISADIHASLSIVQAGGGVFQIAEGIRRVSQGIGNLEADPIAVEVDLRAVGAAMGPGDRLRLDIAGGAFPEFDRNPQTGRAPAEASAAEMLGETHLVLHGGEYPSRLVISALEEAHPLAGASSGGG